MTEKQSLELYGHIFNLTTKNIAIVDADGALQACYFTTRPAHVLRVPDDMPETERTSENIALHADDCLAVSCAMEKIGVLHGTLGVHDLVRPKESCADLRNFWERMVHNFCAKVDEASFRFFAEQVEKHTENPQITVYGVVSRGVALILHYHGEPIDNLLVPAIPTEVCEADRKITVNTKDGYQALMPAKYLLE